MRASALCLALLAGCADPKAPDFYATPRPLPTAPLGQPLRIESIEPFAPGTSAYRILYLSTGLRGEPIAVSGLVGIPAGPAPSGGFDVVSWAHGTTGIVDGCAPSTGRRFNHDAYDVAPDVLAEGWAFVATDYEGLGTEGMHRYLIGDSEARSVLDSVRAVGQLEGVSTSGRVAFWGRSQGGHAALFAGELAGSYAPELTVVGVLAAAPASDVLVGFGGSAFLGGRAAAYNWCMGFSFADAYGLDVATIYDRDTLARVRAALDDGACLAELTTLGLELGGAGMDPLVLEDPGFRAFVDSNTPGRRRQPAPVRIHQGLADTDLPAAGTALLANALCDAGDQVAYVEYPGEDHPSSTALHEPEMLAFTRERFAGAPFVSTCP